MTRAKAQPLPVQLEKSTSLLTDFSRFYILQLLFEGQKHGYQIMSNIEEKFGQKMSPSLVYPFLKLLENQSFVRCELKTLGHRTRKVYSLTGLGRNLCARLFKQLTMLVSTAIESSMQECAHCGCKVYKDVHYEEIDDLRVAFCCRYCAHAYRSET